MARLPRFSLPDLPHLVLQRGHNRQPIVLDDDDRQVFMAQLKAATQRHRVALHAYALLPDQVQLLMTPVDADGIGAVMQDLGRAYVRHFNRRHDRSGTLWEGRYRSCLIQPGERVMDAMVAIDAAAVREGLVAQAADHPWSSAAHGLGQRAEAGLSLPAAYWALGNTPFSREAAYAQKLAHDAPATWQTLSRALQSGWPVGDAAFVDALQRDHDRRLVPGKAGRPKKVSAEGASP